MTDTNGVMKSILDDDTRLGYVHLIVSDLERSLAFYQQSIGLQVHRQEGGTAYLGVGQADLLALTEQPRAVRVPRRTGLYHFAILVPTRLDLAKSLRNLVETKTQLEGWADHLVSEALYLPDPDGNGIEIYHDRPRSTWQYENGHIKMATDPIDYQSLMSELAKDPSPWRGLPAGTMLGHMHLHVAHLAEAETFYREVIGLGLMLNYGGMAAFLSAGGYHHHLGINTWNGVGAAPPPENAIGLRYFVVHLTSQAEQANLIARLTQADAPFHNEGDALVVQDPSQNKILFKVDG